MRRREQHEKISSVPFCAPRSHAKPKAVLLPCWQIHVYNIIVHISLTDSCVSFQYSKLGNSSVTYIVWNFVAMP